MGSDDNHEREPLEPEQDDSLAQRYPVGERGVIYLASLPPGIKPKFIKSLLSAYGTVTRTYLQPESPEKRKRRVQAGGSKSIRYVEGWAEFETRKGARHAAAVMNGNRIGAKKISRFYDDLWSVRYLSGFSWQMLTEKSRIEHRERMLKLQLELAKAKKEDESFLDSLAKSKRLKKKQSESQDELKELPAVKQLAPIVAKRARMQHE